MKASLSLSNTGRQRRLAALPLLIALLLCIGVGSKAWGQSQTQQIGTGTTENNQLPWFGYWNYSYTQQMFTADELESIGMTQGSTISAIAFNYYYSSSSTRPIQVYIGETTSTNLSSSFINVSNFLLAYNNSATFSADWNPTINFTQNYTYNGGNLVIAVLMTKGSSSLDNYNSTSRFYVHSATNMSRTVNNDSYAYTLTNGMPYSNGTAQSGSANSYIETM